MYQIVLFLHSWVRWIVVILAGLAVGRALAGWLGQREWSIFDRRLGTFLTISMDIQLLLGIVLYFGLSPITRNALQDFGAAMADSTQRFWAVEHIFMMVLAVILVHVGQVLVKRAPTAVSKHRWATLLFGAGALVLLLAIPWPFAIQARPWIRLG